MITESNKRQLYDDWCRYWDVSKPVLMEKSPQNILRTRFLQEIFPNSFFLLVVRHPIAVSLATQKWISPLPVWKVVKRLESAVLNREPSHAIKNLNRFTLGSLFEHYIRVHAKCEEDVPYLNNVKILRYEELVDRPSEILDTIFDWLSLEPSRNDHTIEDRNAKYLEEWKSLRRDPFRDLYIRNLMWRYEVQMNHFGYSLQQWR